jgi:hypothetical protein
MNKIKTKVSRETNYIYHMLSAAKCGYDNKYGDEHRAVHAGEDLKTLKENESLITVNGGEHCGELYFWLVSVPAALDTEAPQYYRWLKHLFETGDIEENARQFGMMREQLLTADLNGVIDSVDEFYAYYRKYNSIVPICDVFIRNYPAYCSDIWAKYEGELLRYANDIEDIFHRNGVSDKLEDMLKAEPDAPFIASFCNSIDGGAEAIDISKTQVVFGTGGSYEQTVKFITHEFIINRLKESLKETGAFKDMRYWLYTESLAEFYMELAGLGRGFGGGFERGAAVIEFYKEKHFEDCALSAGELFSLAAESLIMR